MGIIAFGSPWPILILHEVKGICAAKILVPRITAHQLNYGQSLHIVTRVVYIFECNDVSYPRGQLMITKITCIQCCFCAYDWTLTNV